MTFWPDRLTESSLHEMQNAAWEMLQTQAECVGVLVLWSDAGSPASSCSKTLPLLTWSQVRLSPGVFYHGVSPPDLSDWTPEEDASRLERFEKLNSLYSAEKTVTKDEKLLI